MTAMATFRDEQGAGDITQWLHDAPTGLLSNKLHADGKGTAYTYTPDGKLATRAWARGVTTTYAYTNGSSLAAIDYSDLKLPPFFLDGDLSQDLARTGCRSLQHLMV